MKNIFKALFLSLFVAFAALAFAGDPPNKDEKAALAEKCEHGVKKTICSRCHPKLKAVFKAKGDWCEEHERAESQCAICHPELGKEGVKP
jgi:hypothetical protein